MPLEFLVERVVGPACPDFGWNELCLLDSTDLGCWLPLLIVVSDVWLDKPCLNWDFWSPYTAFDWCTVFLWLLRLDTNWLLFCTPPGTLCLIMSWFEWPNSWTVLSVFTDWLWSTLKLPGSFFCPFWIVVVFWGLAYETVCAGYPRFLDLDYYLLLTRFDYLN